VLGMTFTITCPERDWLVGDLALAGRSLAATVDRLAKDALVGSAHYLKTNPERHGEVRQERRAAFQMGAPACGDILVRLQLREEQSE
jgi:hypothetical protein